ncbi:MAG: hypothetical protein ACI9OJ_004540 [Myxococcota bacterium]|jgi:hypothetical protein
MVLSGALIPGCSTSSGGEGTSESDVVQSDTSSDIGTPIVDTVVPNDVEPLGDSSPVSVDSDVPYMDTSDVAAPDGRPVP